MVLSLAITFAVSLAPVGIDAKRYDELRRAGLGAAESKVTVEKLEQAVKLFDRDGDTMYRYGTALMQQERYAEAIPVLGKALELGAFIPKFSAIVHYDIACANAHLGRVDLAFDALEKALNHGYRDLAHLQKDPDLESLHKDARWEKLAATADVTKMNRDEAWRYDLWFMDREVRRIHFNPYRVTGKEELDRFVKTLHDDIPKLGNNQIMAAFVRYMAMIGDGHTAIRPFQGTLSSTPIQPYLFEEGIFIQSTAPEAKELAGAQILEVESKPVESVLRMIQPYMPRDNAMTDKIAAGRLALPAFLHGIGVADTADDLTYKVKDREGKTREVTLKPQDGTANDTWITARDKSKSPLYLKNMAKPYWYEHLPAEKMVYLQYNSVRNDPEEPIPAFAEKLFKFIESNDVETLVVDCRWNGGGNSFLNRSFTHGILKSKINKQGGLYVIIGRQTFSACQNFVTDLERETSPIFVGEPSGSSPNFVGETIRFTLPYSKMTGSISDLYWQRSWPMDNRQWIAPHLPAPPSFDLLMKNIDPAMEAIRKHRQ